MQRFWRFTSEAAQSSTFIIKRRINTLQKPPSAVSDLFSLFKASIPSHKNHLTVDEVAVLRNKLLLVASDSVSVTTILNDNVDSLLSSRSLFLALLNHFNSHPSLLLQVFNWRRKRKVSESDTCKNSMDAHEYSKGIKAAGRCKNIDLAIELFKEAENKGVKISSTYNALMGAFMFNGLADRCYSLFLDMKKDPTCTPNNVTYNIVLSVFGRVMLIDHMEATFKEMRELHLSPNISTYNYLIGGYISSWMWDDMEKVFQVLKSGPVEPNMKTYLLVIRGYAHCGNLEKMEEIYSLVRDHVNENEMSIIRVMICAYCKSSDADKVNKVEALLKLIPEKEYRPWLNLLMIKLYAQENRLEEMENAINDAFEHKTAITTSGIMKCIIAAYFRCNAIENLENFIRRSVFAEWRICHSLFHCKLVMYGSQKNFREMQNVLEEMGDIDMNCNKRTLWIMYKAYSSTGQRSMVLKILGKMFKHGYEIPDDAFPS
ncbi:pentatricopeptide repeat-containing protein at2g30780-like protein [Trifolium pratense]|uniref:Pentatricopeptide repeat-containing protein at2g30780-like protein n=1 Tax=Trifolium pratense TaxID=57577 RepID=A0A2K3N4D2_TRIPR|nr:pentatricopeptide repeat-containing protein at2g30780-like protein [Trifolium pratense]